MRSLIILGVFCLFGVLSAAPASDDNDDDDEKIIIPKSLYHKSLIKYRAKYDIVDILVPLNAINLEKPSNSSESSSESISYEDLGKDVTLFFAVADFKKGKRIDHGIYRYSDGYAKYLLMDGRTIAATKGDNKIVYFGASDGLYINDFDSDWAVKYGPITDGIISMATDETGEIIYIVTDDHKLYNVTNNGENKDLINGVEDAQEIVIDDSNNIYYYNSNKDVFILTANGVVPVENLPSNTDSLKLIRPPFVMEKCVPLMVDNSLYIIYANGTSESVGLEFSPDARPTAYGPEAVLVQYYAYNKRLYEYNIIQLINDDIFEDVKDKTENIKNTASRKKHIKH